ncbi:unnamed protein product [Staurois parvus]|uniref:Uncharacterized protein n=1 Tax=Staurois parvus TaxID=386267 RepID=A0ABN9FNK0_9NEOB|nr:unnamed protein product [Staurois parvus]
MIPQPAFLVPAGPADLCQCCWRCVVLDLSLLLPQLFICPPLPGDFQPGIC